MLFLAELCFYHQALVVGPGAKLEVTYLLIKGKPGHVHLYMEYLLCFEPHQEPKISISSAILCTISR